MNNKYRCLLKDKEYIKIYIANFISNFGNSVDNIAFSWLAYQITESSSWVAVIYGAAFIPRIFLAPLFGVAIENKSKKSVLLFCDMLGVILTVGMVILYYMDCLNAWSLLAFTCLNASIESMRSPAGVAILPKILSENNYTLGTSLSYSSQSIVELLGLGITGFIISTFGISVALIIDSISFMFSLLIILTIKVEEKLDHVKKKLNIDEFLVSLKEGFTYLGSKKIMMFVVMFAAYINFIGTILNAYLPVYVSDYMLEGPEVYSILSVFISLGLVFGGIVTPMFSEKITIRKSFISLALNAAASYFLMILILPIESSIIKVTILSLLFLTFGICSAFVNIKISVTFLSEVENEYMSRVSTVLSSLAYLMIPISSLFLSLLALFIDVSASFVLYGGLCLGVALLIQIKMKD